jgi:hypothetical protein
VLIVTSCNDGCVYGVDPTTGHCQRIAGSKKGKVKDGPGLSAVFHSPFCAEVVASECCVYVTDYHNHCIRRITLPPHWFVAGGLN